MNAQSHIPTHEQVEALAHKWAQQELAYNTRLAYRRDWKSFTLWAAARDCPVLPSRPEAVRLYVAELLATGRKVTTASRHATSIAHYHREAGFASPCDKSVWRVILGARRDRCEKPAQKRPLTVEDLRAMVDGLKGSPVLRVRNRSILLFGFSTALRRANIAGLDLADVAFEERGMLVTIRHEKNDRIGNPRNIAVPAGHDLCPVRAIRDWLDVRSSDPGPLFQGIHRGKLTGRRLHPARISIVVQQAAQQAGKDPAEFGSHSMRAGFCTEALARGAGEIRVCSQTGHRSLESLRKYYRPADPFVGHPGLMFGL